MPGDYPKMPFHIIKKIEEQERLKRDRGQQPQISPYDYPDRPPEKERSKDDKPQHDVDGWEKM